MQSQQQPQLSLCIMMNKTNYLESLRPISIVGLKDKIEMNKYLYSIGVLKFTTKEIDSIGLGNYTITGNYEWIK